ncbi:MAG: 1-(5-phosphoribosyl)-5-[(5-phosphoribosylamino)methylideneamino]imidazole-4-carboxamide isomerase [Candidatus Omnitrophota bacterium]
MLIIPAIDLQDGCVVRLVQGKLEEKKIYSRDPVKTARHWVKLGASFLHVVDLDGAMQGVPKNLGLATDIVKNVRVPVEFGGGIRTLKGIKELLDAGFYRVVLGTKAITDERFLKVAFSRFKDKVIVSIDAKQGSVQIAGWKRNLKGMDPLALCLRLKKTGFKRAIYTDTLKDGTLAGPNIKGIKNLLSKAGLKLIASGGISSLDDIYRLRRLEKEGLEAVIIGKALYEGKMTLSQALRV